MSGMDAHAGVLLLGGKGLAEGNLRADMLLSTYVFVSLCFSLGMTEKKRPPE
jgi:hypothetical protein